MTVTVERQALLKVLKRIEPALSKNDIVHEFNHVWFGKGIVQAGNSQGFAIQTKFKSDFEGGLPGYALLGLLSNSVAKEVNLEQKGSEITLVMRGSKAQLPYLEGSNFLDMPKIENSVTLSDDVVGLFKMILPFTGKGGGKAVEERGVTIIKERIDSLDMFATDDSTITWAYVKGHEYLNCLKVGNRIVLPTKFIEEMVSLSKEGPVTFSLASKAVSASSGDVTVYGKPLTTDTPIDLAKICNNYMQDRVAFKIPQRLRLALARSFVMLDGEKEPHSTISVGNKVLKIITETKHGVLRDSIPLEEDVPEAELLLNPVFLKRALNICTNISLTKKVAVMSGKGFRYFVAPFGR